MPPEVLNSGSHAQGQDLPTPEGAPTSLGQPPQTPQETPGKPKTSGAPPGITEHLAKAAGEWARPPGLSTGSQIPSHPPPPQEEPPSDTTGQANPTASAGPAATAIANGEDWRIKAAPGPPPNVQEAPEPPPSVQEQEVVIHSKVPGLAPTVCQTEGCRIKSTHSFPYCCRLCMKSGGKHHGTGCGINYDGGDEPAPPPPIWPKPAEPQLPPPAAPLTAPLGGPRRTCKVQGCDRVVQEP